MSSNYLPSSSNKIGISNEQRSSQSNIMGRKSKRFSQKVLQNIQFTPRVGEEVYLKKERWKVTRVEHDLEISEINVYMELIKKAKQEKSSNS